MTAPSAPILLRTLPETHLREIGRRWRFDRLFSGPSGDEYVQWVADVVRNLILLHGYQPSVHQLRRQVAAAIVDEQGFLTHVRKKGGSQAIEDSELLTELANAAAGMLVALLVGQAAPRHSRDQPE